ncbi:LOW QUALITY PROTEIN: hypothetical protein V2J09_014795 [Rumex salicifolius]
MKLVFGGLIDIYKEIEQCLVKEGRSHLVRYAIEETQDTSRVYLGEARWRHKKVHSYVRRIHEQSRHDKLWSFVPSAWETWAWKNLLSGFVGIRRRQEWETQCLVHKSSIAQVIDDVNFERNRRHIPSAVECYLRENGATKEETHEEFHAQIESVWKEMNQAMLRPMAVPKALLGIQLNFDRDEDGYTFPENTMKDHVAVVLVNPIPDY